MFFALETLQGYVHLIQSIQIQVKNNKFPALLPQTTQVELKPHLTANSSPWLWSSLESLGPNILWEQNLFLLNSQIVIVSLSFKFKKL